MACNCGGSQRTIGAQAAAGGATRGPQAPGYTWEGPKKRAEQDAAAKPKN